MKRTINQAIVLILLCLFKLSGMAFSQEECNIQLNAEIRHCTCLNNGEIIFKLTKTDSCHLDTLNTRYSLYSPANSISSENSVSPIFKNLPPGDYTGIVNVLHHTGELGSGAIVVLSDTLQLTINSSYTTPSIGILENEYTNLTPFGKVRSLPCNPTGIIQLHINGGTFPYHIKIYKQNGSNYDFFREDIHDTVQHTGTRANKMDYFEYYNVDSLPAGRYRFVLTDGCGYSTPYVETNLLGLPALETLGNKTETASNWDIVSGNNIYIVYFSWPSVLNFFAQNADYYAERQHKGLENYWECRWIDPSVNGSIPDTSDWEPLVFTYMNHHIAAATKYCDLWNKYAVFQVRDISCLGTVSYIYNIMKPLAEFKKTETIKSIFPTDTIMQDSCGPVKTNTARNYYTYSFLPSGDRHQMLTPNNTEGRNMNYIITDAHTNYTIMQGAASRIGANDFSYQTEFTFEDPYYNGRTAKIKVYDAQNCLLYEDNFTISIQETHTQTRPGLIITEQNLKNSYCDYSTMDLLLTNSLYFSERDTISIITSPGDYSNCTLYYDASGDQWIRCDSNTRISTSGNRNQLVIADVIVGGFATIRYKQGCFTTDYNHNFYNNGDSRKAYYEAVPAVYEVEPTCSGMRITIRSGSYKEYSFMPDNTFNTATVISYFRVYGNPHSPRSVTNNCLVGDAINITLEGDIRIVQSLSRNELPRVNCADTATIFHCQKPSVQYDYFYSYCCRIGDTVSTVRTRAKGGVPPYLYVISDKYGNLLDSNYVGDFFNLPLPHHDTVLLKVYDQCGSNFIYRGQVIEQRLLKKVWFDDGSSYKIMTDSNLCQLYAITLNDIDYHWDGPGGFSSDEQNPLFFIPLDSNMSGTYYLSLQDSVCGLIKDSLKLSVIAKNYIPILQWIEDSICSGMEYHRYGFDFNSAPSDIEQVYYDTLITLSNDSTFLRLTLLPVYHNPGIDSIVTALDEFHYGTHILTDTGLFVFNLHTDCGCDSIVQIHLMFSKYLPCPEAIDYDGNVYPSTRIQHYCWTSVNLKSQHYSDGRAIAQTYEYVNDEFPDKEENVNIFGRLYDWYAAMDTGAHQLPDSNGNVHGICPEGWLLPTDEDFASLNIYTPKQLRSPNYWLHNAGNNESGFNSLPAGYYDMVGQNYRNIRGNAYYWTCEQAELAIRIYHLFIDCAILQQTATLCNAYSVRCIKKNE